MPEVHEPGEPLVTAGAPSAFSARDVDSSGVSLATRDYGGDGPALLLMHGAGLEQGSLQPVAEQLRSAFRVVTFDFRGHGRSGSAAWTLATAVADVEAVARSHGLGVPAVGGHSLGGMVAAAYGAEQPGCPGVVNIDGHGRGRVEQYVGYDQDEVRRAWARQDARVARLTGGAGAVALKALLRLMGKRPATTASTLRQVMSEVEALDLFALYRRIEGPLLVFNATAGETSRFMRLWGGEGVSLANAYRKGLDRDFEALAAGRDGVEVVTVDATHMLVRTHAAEVAAHVEGFLERTGSRTHPSP